MKVSLGAKTIAYPTPLFLVGTYDKENRPNVMAAAWGGICCSKPPSVAVSLRAATYSHASILERGAFTINITPRGFLAQADYAGIFSGRDEDKFASLGLTPIKAEFVDAPYVGEFPVVLECSLVQTVEVGLHTQFIGEIKDVKAEKGVLREDGLPDILKVDPVIFTPVSREYYAVGDFLGKAFSIGKKLKS
ncbi:flavin reductase family protein [Desulfovibrio subterraneus]|jgi:flavin reductase (DIM6/NTAB) family NADH-FMN oxidoreductase RutF|uniref:Flavodoxin n=1 Tax=Desulfovibrio subterraneus TaxID=2718620 RepID=A0A7J0BFT4_9BACT|nr:flavin reductase family protein [Desulfovibrio subterraneus]WBF68825.1 flavin reductase family protein [Desulfovibrio subterraneus]GFM32024.1 flavodoxin [Desulfovibrio subterraneus]